MTSAAERHLISLTHLDLREAHAQFREGRSAAAATELSFPDFNPSARHRFIETRSALAFRFSVSELGLGPPDERGLPGFLTRTPVTNETDGDASS